MRRMLLGIAAVGMLPLGGYADPEVREGAVWRPWRSPLRRLFWRSRQLLDVASCWEKESGAT